MGPLHIASTGGPLPPVRGRGRHHRCGLSLVLRAPRHGESGREPPELRCRDVSGGSHLRHLRQRPFGGLRRGGGACPGHRSARARPVHPLHLAGGRAPALSFAEPGAGVPLLRVRCRIPALLPGSREDHGFGRAAHRCPQDLRLEPDRRRAARHLGRAEACHDQIRAGLRHGWRRWWTCSCPRPTSSHARPASGLDPAVARDFSPVGPCVRGSGIARDVRFDHPFDGYKFLVGMSARSHDGCDVQSRTLVRVEEFMDSWI